MSGYEAVPNDSSASWRDLPNELRIIIFGHVFESVLNEQASIVSELTSKFKDDYMVMDKWQRGGYGIMTSKRAINAMCAVQEGDTALLVKAFGYFKTMWEARMGGPVPRMTLDRMRKQHENKTKDWAMKWFAGLQMDEMHRAVRKVAAGRLAASEKEVEKWFKDIGMA